MRTLLLLLAIGILLQFSCSTDLTVDLPPRQQDLAVYAFIDAGDTISSLFANRTAGLKEDLNLNQALLSPPATVTLWDGSDLITSFAPEDESPIYLGTHLPFGTPGQSYLMRAEHPDFGTIEATSTLPTPVAILGVKAIHDFTSRDNELIAHGIEVTFDDPADVTNLYAFSYFDQEFNNTDIFSVDMQLVDIITPTMPDVESIKNSRNVALTDEDFNGQTVTLRFQILNGNFQGPSDQAYLKVRYIDAPEYFHVQSLYSPVEIELEPIIDPSPTYTNFNQGFGVFSLSTTAIYDVEE